MRVETYVSPPTTEVGKSVCDYLAFYPQRAFVQAACFRVQTAQHLLHGVGVSVAEGGFLCKPRTHFSNEFVTDNLLHDNVCAVCSPRSLTCGRRVAPKHAPHLWLSIVMVATQKTLQLCRGGLADVGDRCGTWPSLSFVPLMIWLTPRTAAATKRAVCHQATFIQLVFARFVVVLGDYFCRRGLFRGCRRGQWQTRCCERPPSWQGRRCIYAASMASRKCMNMQSWRGNRISIHRKRPFPPSRK